MWLPLTRDFRVTAADVDLAHSRGVSRETEQRQKRIASGASDCQFAGNSVSDFVAEFHRPIFRKQ